jgi:hypothetical protein
MKKFVSILLAMVMSLTLASAALAEAPAFEEVTVEFDESYVEAPLGEECYTFIPADWAPIEDAAVADEKITLLGAFANADKTMSLAVTYAVLDAAATYESLYNEIVAGGFNAALQNINGTEYACMAATSEAGAVIAYTFLANEEGTEAIIFTFSVAASVADTAEPIVNQILASFGYYEAEEE